MHVLTVQKMFQKGGLDSDEHKTYWHNETRKRNNIGELITRHLLKCEKMRGVAAKYSERMSIACSIHGSGFIPKALRIKILVRGR